MLRTILAAWRPVALAALLALAVAPTGVRAAGHGGMHYGGYNAGGYRPGYFGGYHGGYGYDHRGYDYGYSSPGLYSSAAYLSGGYEAPPDHYYSPDYTTAAPDYGLSASYTPDATAPAPAAAAPAAVPGSTPGLATVDVNVPASAQLWFNGSATKQTGDARRFTSPSLTPGQDYTYAVRRWTDNRHVTDETRTITVHAYEVTFVDFTEPAPTASAAK